MKPMRKKILFWVVKGLALFLLAVPLGAFAASAAAAPSGGSGITIEFRYTEGEEGNVSIPSTIERYGTTYRLQEQRPAVLEREMEATRTYTWSIDGFISEQEAARLQQEYPGLVLTPVIREGSESVDRIELLTGLPTNDVDAIAYTLTDEQGEFRRAAVRFEIEKDENGMPKYDRFGLPASYTAEVVYRGLAGVSVPGYYNASQTYETTEALDSVDQYVIVTNYVPVSGTAAAATSTGSAGGTGAEGSAGNGTAAQTGMEEDAGPIEIGSLAESAEPSAIPNAAIADEQTPQTAPSAGNFADTVKAVLFIILKIVLIAAAAFGGFLLVLILRNKVRRRRKLRMRAVSQGSAD